MPDRCLYSSNDGNLLLAALEISVTHVVPGALRVMHTTAMMGELAGMASRGVHKGGDPPAFLAAAEPKVRFRGCDSKAGVQTDLPVVCLPSSPSLETGVHAIKERLEKHEVLLIPGKEGERPAVLCYTD